MLVACTSPGPTHDASAGRNHTGHGSTDRWRAVSVGDLRAVRRRPEGIYEGCGPNGNVCHNERQYPNMDSLGAFTLNIGQPCNQLQNDPTAIDDWCERVGDTVTIGHDRMQLAYIQLLNAATMMQGSQWRIVVQGGVPASGRLPWTCRSCGRKRAATTTRSPLLWPRS